MSRDPIQVTAILADGSREEIRIPWISREEAERRGIAHLWDKYVKG